MEANYYERPCEKHPVKTILRISFLILNKMEPLKGFEQRYDVMIWSDLDFNKITPAVLARMGSREARKVQGSPDNHAHYDVNLFSPSFQFCILCRLHSERSPHLFFFKKKIKENKLISFYPYSCSFPLISDQDHSTLWDLTGGPMAKTPHSQCRRPELDPWLGNKIPHAAKKKNYSVLVLNL